MPFLTWTQILEMKRDGFSFYSLTYDLHQKKRDEAGNLVPPLTNRLFLPKEKRTESEQERKQRVSEDLLLGEAFLKTKLRNQLSFLCFPFGNTISRLFRMRDNLDFRSFSQLEKAVTQAAMRKSLA